MKIKVLLIFSFLSCNAFAENFIRYNPATGEYLGCQNYGDTSIPLNNPNNLNDTKPGFIYANPFCSNVLPSVPERYRKVVAGVVLEMTQAEKNAVDAPILAAQAKAQAISDELSNPSTNDICAAEDFSSVSNKIQAVHDNLNTQIQAMTTLANAKTVLGNLNDVYAVGLAKIARCAWANNRHE